MAILRVSDELIKEEPTTLILLMEYFDSMEELMPDRVGEKRYAVQKDGLPKDNTVVECILQRNDKGEPKVIWCDV